MKKHPRQIALALCLTLMGLLLTMKPRAEQPAVAVAAPTAIDTEVQAAVWKAYWEIANRETAKPAPIQPAVAVEREPEPTAEAPPIADVLRVSKPKSAKACNGSVQSHNTMHPRRLRTRHWSW